MNDNETIQLIEKCRKGERKAQQELYSKYYRAMYNTSLRIVNNTAEAEDVMQESFIAAFNKLNSYKGEVPFGSWLKKIVINRSIDLLRKRKLFFIEITGLKEKAEDTSNIDEIEITPESVKHAISLLKPNYRVILTLFLLDGYDHDEIAEILMISNNASRTTFHRAKEKLKETLKNMKFELHNN